LPLILFLVNNNAVPKHKYTEFHYTLRANNMTSPVTDTCDLLWNDGLLAQANQDTTVADLFNNDDAGFSSSSPSFGVGSPTESTLTLESDEDLIMPEQAFTFDDFFGMDEHQFTLTATPSLPPLHIQTTDREASQAVAAPVKKSNGGRKRKAGSAEEKEARARERILRNRYAAQQSRDKKRRHMVELEAANAALEADNEHLSKRVRFVEQENAALHKKFDALAAQLAQLQSQLALSEMTKLLLDGACTPAVCAALESRSAPRNDPACFGGEDDKDSRSSKQSPYRPFTAVAGKPRGVSKKSPQRPVKKSLSSLRSNSKLASTPFLSQTLKPFLVTFWILSWISTGKALLPMVSNNTGGNSNTKGCSADEQIVVPEPNSHQREAVKRLLRSMARGCRASRHEVPREWRNWPP